MTTQLHVDARTLGVNFREDNKAEVVVWAPLASQVALKLKTHPGVLPLTREDLGYWCLTTDAIRPGDLYTFVLDGDKERPDPASLAQPQGVHGPSQAVDVRQFPRQDHHWTNHALSDYVLYELHVGTFTPEGTFAAAAEKLDHLVALGVTAIEIMPVAQFPDARNWGYDGVFPYAVQHSYGGAGGLKNLVDACHAHGIAVVLDVVYNHFGPEGNYFRDFGPYFTSTHCTPWGDAINFDADACDCVRRYFIENALMWFRDFRIDALRLDAVHAIIDFSPSHILRDIREHVDQLMVTTRRQHYLIVECDLNDPRFIDPLAEGGYGMDAQWNDEFHHALRVTVGEERKSYYADYGGVGDLAKAYRDAYVHDGQFSGFRQRPFGHKVDTNPGQQFVVFSQNHDQVGNRMLGERSSQLVSFDRLKVMAGAVMVSPFLPLLFMGEEWGESNPFLYFVSHTDPDLAETVREGRKKEFSAFNQHGEAPDPMAMETFSQSKLQWELLRTDPHQILLRYYQTLIALRKRLPALRHPDRQRMTVVEQPGQSTLIVHRWHDEQHVLCLLNFANAQEPVTLPEVGQLWQKQFDSTEPQWAAPDAPASGSAPDMLTDAQILVLPPQSFIIYTQRHV
ncbi:MAG: malto-oligosyltrehalose trehalohydrolase [Bacteroidetes bacterium]|nr:malto-oligosyltrehalose trehalohydrolase [Fibrella sp.]